MKDSILDLANNECRGIIRGGYCAEPVVPGKTYCAKCYVRMHRPTPMYHDNQQTADYVANRPARRSSFHETEKVEAVDEFIRGRQ